MAQTVNVNRVELKEMPGPEGFGGRRASLTGALGCRRLGFSVWEVAPGMAAYPYHLHLGEEEAVILLSGTARLRTPSGWRTLEEGEIVSFPAGDEGAHQIVNPTGVPIRFLAVSTNGAPDIMRYPDSGKVSLAERRPRGGGLRMHFREMDSVGYWEGEAGPDEHP